MMRLKKIYGVLGVVLSISALTLWASCQKQAKASDPLRVMTYNIRYDNQSDGINRWSERLGRVEAFLDEEHPDLIGAQEVLKNQLDDMLSILPTYGYIGVGREDGKEAGEYSPIFYNKERVELVDGGYFWLSETPEAVASVGWDAALERIATWGLFKDLQSDSLFFMLNTHFDHVGDIARINSAALIQERVKEWQADYPVVVTGDFNLPPESAPVRQIKNPQVEGFLYDSFEMAPKRVGASWTFHDFGELPVARRERIDYILYQGAWSPISYTCFDEEDHADKVYLSDHNPVMVELVRR
ncbi:MAG: endonuclease/exonuclease/phosphatase family protein [Porphyromonas sp.]|nr:endonuclease/exonuclease/phosphatase family protein [Porphyromonas sp.]